MSSIKDLHNPWRDKLLPASFRNALFHCESGSREGGRRIVTHEFPKKENPYSEDMGRKSKTFSVRAYCIAYPFDASELLRRDYTRPRNRLLQALEEAGPGTLQLPLLPAENVVVNRYRLTEEDRFGGYCVFDIQFDELGIPPNQRAPSRNTAAELSSRADAVREQAKAGLGNQPQTLPL
jgi:prophage DNA circulation protein